MKRRSKSHLIDARGIVLLQQALPTEWVIREYKPDYGVDYAIEVFDYVTPHDLVTLGEHFYIQLKSASRLKRLGKTIHPRGNVEMAPLSHDKSSATVASVIAFAIDSDELALALSMGPAVPLLLVCAELETSTLYWVCLNDVADKLMRPVSAFFDRQQSHTVHLPTRNVLDGSAASLTPLRLFSRRGKLYAAFNRFQYQRREIVFALERHEISRTDESRYALLELVKHFLSISLAYDFWRAGHGWPALESTHALASSLQNVVERALSGEPLEVVLADSLAKQNSSGWDPTDLVEMSLSTRISIVFDQFASLGSLFEEICREWFLPSYLGELTTADSDQR